MTKKKKTRTITGKKEKIKKRGQNRKDCEEKGNR